MMKKATTKSYKVNFNRPASEPGGQGSTGWVNVFLHYIEENCLEGNPFDGDPCAHEGPFRVSFRFDWEEGEWCDCRTWHSVKDAFDISDEFMRDLQLAACAAMRELQTIFTALGCPDVLQHGLQYGRFPRALPCGGLLAETVAPNYWDQFNLGMSDATAYSLVFVLAVQNRILIAKELGLDDRATAEDIVRAITFTIASEKAVPSKRDGSGAYFGNVCLRQETFRRIRTYYLGLQILRCTKLVTVDEDNGVTYDTDADFCVNTLGIPRTLVSLLAALKGLLREKLCMDDMRLLIEKFPQAIRAGADLSNVWTELIIWLLTDRQNGLLADAQPPLEADELAVIESIVELFRQRCCQREAWREIAEPPAKKRRGGNEGVIATARKVAGIMASLPESNTVQVIPDFADDYSVSIHRGTRNGSTGKIAEITDLPMLSEMGDAVVVSAARASFLSRLVADIHVAGSIDNVAEIADESDMAALSVETVKAILEALVQRIACDFKRAHGPSDPLSDAVDDGIYQTYCAQMYGCIATKLLALLAAAPFCE